MTVWEDVVGQEAACATLQEAARAARARLHGDDAASTSADKHMSHAWLITGPPGSGRSNAALAFAAALQCTGPTPGCGQCPGCRTTLAHSNADVLHVSTESTQLRIDEVRTLIPQAQAAPSQGMWRVIIMEDADRMLERTANVLLKAIEEPPERTVWLLCAPSPEDMIQTIRSRCRHVGLRIPPAHAVADLLVARDGADPAVALEAARAAQSHIGLARALARDPGMRERRRTILTGPLTVRSVGEAVLAAAELVQLAEEQTESLLSARHAEEEAQLMRLLGIDGDTKVPPQARAQLRDLKKDQERRAKRAVVDTLDRILVDMLAVNRDVLMCQLGTDQGLVNTDLAELVADIAAESTPEQTMARVDAIEETRRRLAANGNPTLILEALIVALRPQH